MCFPFSVQIRILWQRKYLPWSNPPDDNFSDKKSSFFDKKIIRYIVHDIRKKGKLYLTILSDLVIISLWINGYDRKK